MKRRMSRGKRKVVMLDKIVTHWNEWGSGATAYEVAILCGLSPSSYVTDLIEELALEGWVEIRVKPNGKRWDKWSVYPSKECLDQYYERGLFDE